MAACPVGAMQKTPEGPVIYHRDRCIGCRYCMVACPWSLPRFDWQDSVPYIHKCTMCFDRLQAGERPACAKHLPDRSHQLRPTKQSFWPEARRRLERWPGRYIPHIYGEKEVGGTSVLYLSPAPFEQVGWPAMGSAPVNRYTAEIMSKVPLAFVGVAAAMGGIYWFSKRREDLAEGRKNPMERGMSVRTAETRAPHWAGTWGLGASGPVGPGADRLALWGRPWRGEPSQRRQALGFVDQPGRVLRGGPGSGRVRAHRRGLHLQA